MRYPEEKNQLKQLNSITKIVMLTSKMFVIPMASFVLLVALLPGTGIAFNIIKYSIVLGASIFALRGYFLIAMLSQVDSHAKNLYSIVNSIVARGKHRKIDHVRRLLMILEDVSCSRSHLMIREFGSGVTQRDVFNSFASTMSIITLLISFSGQRVRAYANEY